MRTCADFIVIGAGIAGTSAAAELAAHGNVILLEMEHQPGYHTTSRSAAFFAAAYGSEIIRNLTGMSEQFFLCPPEEFTDVRLIRLRDCMFFGRADQQERLQQMHVDNPRLIPITGGEVHQRVPILSADNVVGALWDKKGGDLDVDAILQGYVRLLRRREGMLLTNQKVDSLTQNGTAWIVDADGKSFHAPVIVNAAGAWADCVAEMAGLSPLGFTPMRRTALTIDPPKGLDVSEWPLMVDADEAFYFKPDAGQILISPADATPFVPCDVHPDDVDVMVAVDRFEKATGIDVRRVNHAWAGLRTFAPDQRFVVGFDPRAKGFFWLAGQGGAGVQSSPSMSHLTAALASGSQPAQQFSGVMDYVEELAPERLIAC